jgi:N-acetylglucosaminyl-diphospho-decaprenol L-rhamnosyltransferase
MDVSVIIVNWHSREHLRKCLASIVAGARTIHYEIVVIDSGSFDGCAEMVGEHFPQVRFIQSAENLGFSKANNQASEIATGDCLLFLNPDTEIVDSAIDELHAALISLPNAGIVGGRLINADGTLQSSCIQAFPTLANQALNSEFLRKRWPKSTLWGMAPLFEHGRPAYEVEGISGACLMIRRSLFEQVGRFSEDYFMYVEDMDLSCKVAGAGYQNYYVPGATVTHYGGQSSDQAANTFAAVMIPEAIRRFLRKSRGSAYSAAYRVMMVLMAIGRLSVLCVAWILGGWRTPALAASCRKWFAIFRWGFNCDGIVAQYYRKIDEHLGRSV